MEKYVLEQASPHRIAAHPRAVAGHTSRPPHPTHKTRRASAPSGHASQQPTSPRQRSKNAAIMREVELQRTLDNLPQAIGHAVAEANKPMKEMLMLAHEVVAKRAPSRAQKVADVVHRWALPVVQVLLGAAVVVLGASIMEISIMVLGATMCATGIALCLTLAAGTLAPHPLDSIRNFVKRRQQQDPEFYKPGMVVALDAV